MMAQDLKIKLGFLLDPEVENVGESVAEQQQLRRQLLVRLQVVVDDYLAVNEGVIQELVSVRRKKRFLDISRLFIPDFLVDYTFWGQ